MTRSFFVTGTDTDVGKTYCTSLLLTALSQSGHRCIPFKPIAAGCEWQGNVLKNDDALSLIKASNCELDYSLVNPYAFEPAIAPHIAAEQVGKVIALDQIQAAYDSLLSYKADCILIEGAGGWHLPIALASKQGPEVLLSDWVIEQEFPVILVVGMKLGCLNHCLLTLKAIEAAGGKVLAWIANQCHPDMDYYQDNLASLQSLIEAPLLAEVKYAERDPKVFAQASKLLFS